MSHILNKLRVELLRWYEKKRRALPWRGSGDPYKIWLSEVIMQQTRVAQGTPYYLKFIEAYPRVADLAQAEEQEILKLWQGLGYYSRGRNLLKAARQVVSVHNGFFPEEYNEVIKLSGIGPYTAAAIVSIAFNKPHAVLDGNVYRVLARVFGIALPINAPGAAAHFQKQADSLLDKKSPGTFNEAMMELGAMICTPKNPLCDECPISSHCEAYKLGTQSELPQKLALKAVKTRYFHYLFVRDTDQFLLCVRQAGDIWQGLYELPLVETVNDIVLSQNEAGEKLGMGLAFIKPLKKMTHKLTHQRLDIHFYEADLATRASNAPKGFVFANADGLKQYPLPKPLELFLNDYLCIR